MNPEHEGQILLAIGLKHKIGREDLRESAHLHSAEFGHYVRPSYVDSEEYSTDEVHRMYETIRIHKPTGIRFYCLSHESYDGQSVEYTFFRVHVVTRSGKTLPALSVDLSKHVVGTPEGEIAFLELSTECP
jgi:hypothetical protein